MCNANMSGPHWAQLSHHFSNSRIEMEVFIISDFRRSNKITETKFGKVNWQIYRIRLWSRQPSVFLDLQLLNLGPNGNLR